MLSTLATAIVAAGLLTNPVGRADNTAIFVQLNPSEALKAADTKSAADHASSGVAHRKAGQSDLAMTDFDAALKLDKDNLTALIGRGLTWFDKQNYDKAIADFSAAIRVNPHTALAFASRGIAYEQKRQLDAATSDLLAATRLDPDNDQYTVALNRMQQKYETTRATQTYRDQCFNGAGATRVAACDYLISTGTLSSQELATAYQDRGTEYATFKYFDQAILDFTAAIRIAPTTEMFVDRSNLFLARFEYERALEDASEAIRRDPKNAAGYINRGFAYRMKGLPDKAIAELTAALQIKPGDNIALLTRGLSYADKHDYDHAIANFDEIISHKVGDTDTGSAYRERALAYLTKKDYVRAVGDHDEAVRLNPSDGAAFSARGVAHEHRNEIEKAFDDYTASYNLNPADKDANDGLMRTTATASAIKLQHEQGARRQMQIDSESTQIERNLADSKPLGEKFAADARVVWTVTTASNPKTGTTETTIRSVQSNFRGAAADVQGKCIEGGNAAFTAALARETDDGKALQLPTFNDTDPTKTFLGAHRQINDSPQRAVALASDGQQNRAFVIFLTSPATHQLVLSDMEELRSNPSLLDFVLFVRRAGAARKDTTWGVTADVDTSAGKVVIKIPTFDTAVRKFLDSCH